MTTTTKRARRRTFKEGRHILSLEVELRSMSLRKLAWARIKGLFGAGHDRVA